MADVVMDAANPASIFLLNFRYSCSNVVWLCLLQLNQIRCWGCDAMDIGRWVRVMMMVMVMMMMRRMGEQGGGMDANNLLSLTMMGYETDAKQRACRGGLMHHAVAVMACRLGES